MQISPVIILFVSIISSSCLQDMSSRHLQDMSSTCLENMSSRRLQDMSLRHLEHFFSVTIFGLARRLQDMSLRHLEHFFSVTIFGLARRLQDVLQDVFKTSWKTKNYYTEDVLKTSSRLTNVCCGI